MKEGWVYFIERLAEYAPAGRLIKIGFTIMPTERMYALQSEYVARLRLLTTIPGTMEMEKGLHRLFSQERIEGEWFNPAAGLLEIIRTGTVPPLPPKPPPLPKPTGAKPGWRRVIIDIPEEYDSLWYQARGAALEQEVRIGRFIMDAVRRELERLEAVEQKRK